MGSQRYALFSWTGSAWPLSELKTPFVRDCERFSLGARSWAIVATQMPVQLGVNRCEPHLEAARRVGFAPALICLIPCEVPTRMSWLKMPFAFTQTAAVHLRDATPEDVV